ncbi:MAG: family 1 glycosylhydrolase [Collinsella sp.]
MPRWLRTLRVSIQWTRLFPTGTEEQIRSRRASTSTRDLFKTMKEAGIEPLVTLHHYEMPLYLANHYDGWGKREVIDFFVRYCEVCFREFGEYVKYWLTFNEIDSVFRHPGPRSASAPTAIPQTSARSSSTSVCTTSSWRVPLPPRCSTRWCRARRWAVW